jgi:hypothetical protein
MFGLPSFKELLSLAIDVALFADLLQSRLKLLIIVDLAGVLMFFVTRLEIVEPQPPPSTPPTFRRKQFLIRVTYPVFQLAKLHDIPFCPPWGPMGAKTSSKHGCGSV